MRFKVPIRLFLLIAVGVSAYLVYASLRGSGVAGCGPESGCDEVLQSRWSRWFGIPVSAFSVLVYGALLALTFRFGRKSDPTTERTTWRLIIPVAILAVLAVVYFAALQFFVLHRTCPFCMSVHASGLIAAVLILVAAPIREAPDKPWQAEKQVFVPPRSVATLSLMALAAFALFAGGQAMQKEKTYTFKTYDGRFQFDLNDVPLIGSPRNTNAIISLFDYTCHHCRIMHGHLMEAHRKLSNQLSIISLPNPLDSHCNPNVRQTPPPHQQACDYAKLGLAVWRANRKMQHQFDDWIFDPEKPPPLEKARQYATDLVGSNQLARAMQDPWVEKTLNQAIALYSTNYIHLKMGNMPQLIIGTNILGGTFRDTAEMYKVFEKQLGIKPPSS
ncbi:MAG TPA: vitamin K epoxide reductase family protein [Candidatus Binatia bacterium]|nr:vitamin K epoxide reductase family protein [Candidatus Binatia bacterium]